jgi:hypothetical protein
MSKERDPVGATLEHLYPPVIGGPGWDDVLDRLEADATVPEPPERGRATGARRWIVGRPLIAPIAAVVAIIVLAAPALAFSPKIRELVGLKSAPYAPHQTIVAKLTGVRIRTPYPRYGPPLVTVTFTVGEAGKAPGTGVPRGSALFVALVGKSGSPGKLVKAQGSHGRYQATGRAPVGGIKNILIGGWINVTPQQSPTANKGFWIPVVNLYTPE